VPPGAAQSGKNKNIGTAGEVYQRNVSSESFN
jgi:hypothetical protein